MNSTKLKQLALITTVAAGLAFGGSSAKADYYDIDLTGWKSYAGFGSTANTSLYLDFGAGTLITGFDYSNLSFATANGSWLSEFTLSLNNSDASEYLDWSPSTTDSSGTFEPASGSWGGLTGAAGPYGPGAPGGLLPDGILWVTVYEAYDDGGAAVLDATVTSGTLRVYYTAVPEPTTGSLLALGLLGCGAIWRKGAARRQRAQ